MVRIRVTAEQAKKMQDESAELERTMKKQLFYLNPWGVQQKNLNVQRPGLLSRLLIFFKPTP
jgi:hypothetical protein